ETGGLASVAVLGGHERGDRDEVIGVGRVTESQEQRDPERKDERCSVEETAQCVVEVLHLTRLRAPLARPGQVRGRRRPPPTRRALAPRPGWWLCAAARSAARARRPRRGR